MDPDIIAAFIAVEDRRFYEHWGVDLRAIARAALVNLRAGRVVSGGSTISMQLARILRGTPRSWNGKLSQVLWALRLERHLSQADDSRALPQSRAAGPGSRRCRSRRRTLFLGIGVRGQSRSGGPPRGARASAVARYAVGLRRASSTKAACGTRPIGRLLLRHRRYGRPSRCRAAALAGIRTPTIPGATFHDPRRELDRARCRVGPGNVADLTRSSPPGRARGGGASYRRESHRSWRQSGRGGRARQRYRRDPRLDWFARLLGRHRRSGGHGHLATAARLGAQAVSVCAGIRSWVHTGTRFSPTSPVCTRLRPAPLPGTTIAVSRPGTGA